MNYPDSMSMSEIRELEGSRKCRKYCGDCQSCIWDEELYDYVCDCEKSPYANSNVSRDFTACEEFEDK